MLVRTIIVEHKIVIICIVVDVVGMQLKRIDVCRV
jgi:hypothetical protein